MNYETTYDQESTSITIRSDYRPDMNFRDACFYTANLIRSSTKKNLIFLHSGGADSTAFSYVFRHENIDVKRIHLRYFYRGNIINTYENSNIFEKDITIYDVDVEEFERSELHISINKRLPYHVFLTLQTYYPDLDPDNDLIIRGASTLPIRNINGIPIFTLPAGSTLLPLLYPCECIDFLQHNKIMLTSIFTDKYIMDQVASMKEGGVYSWWYKEELYKHYFPEVPSYRFIPKSKIAFWKGFDHLHVNAGRGIFKNYDGTIVDSYPQRTYFKYYYNTLTGFMKSNNTVKLTTKWNFDGDYFTTPDTEIEIS